MNQQPMSTLAQLAALLAQPPQASTSSSANAASTSATAKLIGDGTIAINRVHTDTRTLQAGDLFVALRGERFDANDFLEQARVAGAAAALCHPAHLQAMGWSGLEVPDTHQALQQLARAWRKQFALPLIAVTGSNGKTTVTQMVASILRIAAGDAALATQGNLNNDIGVPLTLLRLRPTHKLAVVELGMNHPGEIAALAALAAPTVALVNNAQREHQEFMGTVEAVAHENGQAIVSLPANGVAVFPADDAYSPLWQHMAGQRQCLRFALDENTPASATSCKADIYASALMWHGDHWQVQAQTPVGACQFALHIAGKHNVKNALAAAACALAAGVGLAHIAQGLSAFAPVAGRSRAVALHWQGKPLTLVDDSYNANPDSVLAAIDVLRDLPAPRLLVLGDMGEVGNQGAAFHAEVGQYAAQQGIEHLLTLGALAQHSALQHPAAQHCGDSASNAEHINTLWQAVQTLLPQVNSIVVKGSRFMQMDRIASQLVQAASVQNAPKEAGTC